MLQFGCSWTPQLKLDVDDLDVKTPICFADICVYKPGSSEHRCSCTFLPLLYTPNALCHHIIPCLLSYQDVFPRFRFQYQCVSWNGFTYSFAYRKRRRHAPGEHGPQSRHWRRRWYVEPSYLLYPSPSPLCSCFSFNYTIAWFRVLACSSPCANLLTEVILPLETLQWGAPGGFKSKPEGSSITWDAGSTTLTLSTSDGSESNINLGDNISNNNGWFYYNGTRVNHWRVIAHGLIDTGPIYS